MFVLRVNASWDNASEYFYFCSEKYAIAPPASLLPIQSEDIYIMVQSGASSPAKHGGAYFSAVYGSIEDPVAAPGPCKPQVC